MNKLQWFFAATSVVALCSSLTACASSSESSLVDSLSLPAGASEAQAEAVSDKVVDADEYQAGFKRYSSCLADAGYEVVVKGEVNFSVDYAVPDAAVQSGSDQACYEGEFQLIDMMWQLAHQDTSQSTQKLRDCLTEHGITPEETTDQIVEQLTEAGIGPEDCA